MTEAITITAIIVGGLVSLVALALYVGFKAWRIERAAKADAVPASPAINIHAIDLDPEAANRAYKNHLDHARGSI